MYELFYVRQYFLIILTDSDPYKHWPRWERSERKSNIGSTIIDEYTILIKSMHVYTKIE